MALALPNPLTTKPIAPLGTIAFTAGTSSSSKQFSTIASINAPNVLVENGSTTIDVYVGYGLGSATAAVPTDTESQNATRIAPGMAIVMLKGVLNDTCAAITASSTATIFFTAMQGA